MEILSIIFYQRMESRKPNVEFSRRCVALCLPVGAPCLLYRSLSDAAERVLRHTCQWGYRARTFYGDSR